MYNIYSKIADQRGTYYSALILLAGTVGNLLLFLVIRKTTKRSIGLLLRALSVGNLLDLWLYLFPMFIYTATRFSLRDISVLTCKLIPYFSYSSTDFTVFIIIISAVDRLVAIWFPLKMRNYCTARNAFAALIMVSLLSLSISIPTMLARGITSKGTCGHTSLQYYMDYIHTWVIFTAISIFPAVTLGALNLA